MERVKNMDKFTVLSEIKKMLKKQPIKVTDIGVNKDIFEIPKEKKKINKTSLLYTVRDGKKNIYVPIVKEKEKQEDPVRESTINRLLKKGQFKDILSKYINQEREEEMTAIISNSDLVRLFNKIVEKKEPQKKEPQKKESQKKEPKETELSHAIIPVEKKEKIIKTEEEKEEEKDVESEDEDIQETKKKYQKYQARLKKRLLIPVVDEQIKIIKEENPGISDIELENISKALEKEVKDIDIYEEAENTVKSAVKDKAEEIKRKRTQGLVKAREAKKAKEEAKAKAKEEEKKAKQEAKKKAKQEAKEKKAKQVRR